MKILIAAGIFPPDIGGPAIYSEQIAKEFNSRGIKTDVICFSDKKLEDDYNFKVCRILRRYPSVLRYFLYFFRILIIGRSYDLIYAQGPVCSGYPAMLANIFLKKKFAVKVTGDYAWEQARNTGAYSRGIDRFQKKKFKGKIDKLKTIETKVCRTADLVITPCQYLKEIVKGWGINQKKIIVIYNSIKKDTSFFSEKDNNLILSIGRLVPWKGFETLIRIMPDLLKENPDFRLRILGSGPQKQYLENLISKQKLRDRISISKKPKEEIPKCLKEAGVFILNSDYEGLSHVILEALEAGTPVITTNLGGNPEIIRDRYNGILVEYDKKKEIEEAILELYKNQELKEEFNRNSKEVLRKFDFDKMIEDTIIVFKDLCAF